MQDMEAYALKMASPVAQTVKNPPAMQETQARSLGWEDPVEKEMASHSSILAWKIPWTEDGCSPWCYKESGATERLTLVTLIVTIGTSRRSSG